MNPMALKEQKAPQDWQATFATELGMDTVAHFFKIISEDSEGGVNITSEELQEHLELLHHWMGQTMEVENIMKLIGLIGHSGCIAYPGFHNAAKQTFREYWDMTADEREAPKSKVGRPPKQKASAALHLVEASKSR